MTRFGQIGLPSSSPMAASGQHRVAPKQVIVNSAQVILNSEQVILDSGQVIVAPEQVILDSGQQKVAPKKSATGHPTQGELNERPSPSTHRPCNFGST